MIYLDNHATTICDAKVLKVMLPYFSLKFGNSSSNHYFGNAASEAVYLAQSKISLLINCLPEEIYFTSGATESNNLALLGTCRYYKLNQGNRKGIVTTRIEHKSVLAPIEQLRKEGWNITYLKVDRSGLVDLQHAQEVINEDTFLTSVQLANSEIGTIQPIDLISGIARDKGSLMHCDASQAVGKISIDLLDMEIDFLSLSGHKIYGPKGIGAIWIRNKYEKEIIPLMYGGSYPNSIRPGTLPIPLIAGLGKACELSTKYLSTEKLKMAQLRNHFESILFRGIKTLIINGSIENRLPNNSNITFPDIDAEALLANIPNIMASSTSACESGSIEPSRVLLEIGLSPEEAFCTLRFGLGRFTTLSEIEVAGKCIIEACKKIEKMVR